MGNISGTSKLRPQFSPEIIRLLPQTPIENISFLNISHSAPSKLQSNLQINVSNAELNDSYNQNDDNLFVDEQMETDNEDNNNDQAPKLCLKDLMSPESVHCDDDNQYISPILNRSLNEEFDNLSPINCNNDNDDELQEAIQSAIQRRLSFEPKVVMEQSRLSLSTLTINNSNNNDVRITKMNDIKQCHRFIQFYINPQQMKSKNVDEIKSKCQELLEHYITILTDDNSDHVINHKTVWFNINTKQCTFYLLIHTNMNNDNCDNKQKQEWSKIFLGIIESYSWIQSNQDEIVFSQFAPKEKCL